MTRALTPAATALLIALAFHHVAPRLAASVLDAHQMETAHALH
ncbi:hypothetical protein [Maritimibacter sp. 55A14]|nr:hypothetical protein [Maritimibacter sp. 55A14]